MRIELDDLPLIDHHCHALVRTELDRAGLERMLSEGGPPGPGTSRFDTALGLAVRRHCAPLLDLPAHASAADYCARRSELGMAVSTRLLHAAHIDRFLVDTGLAGDDLGSRTDLARLAGRPAYEVVRLERVAEDLAARGADASVFAGEEAAPSGAFDVMRDDALVVCGARAVLAVHLQPQLARGIVAADPGVVNAASDELDSELATAVRRWLAAAGFRIAPEFRSCGSDDFSFYGRALPSQMVFLGLGPGVPALHSADFLAGDDLVEDAAVAMIACYVAALDSLDRTSADRPFV